MRTPRFHAIDTLKKLIRTIKQNFKSSVVVMISLIVFLLIPMSSFAKTLKGDGVIRIFSYHVDEYLEITYLDKNGHWIPEAYDKLNHLLRSRDENAQTKMDPRLIELADHLQDHFGTDTIEVISGFRSPAFNQKLKSEGHNVANESFHTKGKAMDIHLDEINEAAVRDYLLKNHDGGVGYYGNRLMVHMDFGPKRTWQDGGFVENTNVGLFNKQSTQTIRTDRFYYKAGDVQKLQFAKKVWSKARLELFHRGKWIETCSSDAVSGQMPEQFAFDLKSSCFLKSPRVFGKYRWHFEGPQQTWQRSNEFYLKKN